MTQAFIITNGGINKATMDGYLEQGYIHVATMSAKAFHSKAIDGDTISFFAKPIID